MSDYDENDVVQPHGHDDDNNGDGEGVEMEMEMEKENELRLGLGLGLGLRLQTEDVREVADRPQMSLKPQCSSCMWSHWRRWGHH